MTYPVRVRVKGELKNKNKNSAAHVIGWAYSTIYVHSQANLIQRDSPFKAHLDKGLAQCNEELTPSVLSPGLQSLSESFFNCAKFPLDIPSLINNSALIRKVTPYSKTKMFFKNKTNVS